MISMMASKKHISVLLNKSIEMLNIKPDGVYVDATAGMGGHSSLILASLHKGKLICMDQDNYAISVLKEKFGNNKNVTVVKTNFADIVDTLNELGINKVDGIIADLGVSSPMFDNPDRGFSYKFDAKLDMRMNQEQKLDAWFIVNKYSYERLTNLFTKYGEANEAKKVARAICKYRDVKPIDTTLELVDIIKDSVSIRNIHKKKHPARVYFQALRIEVNDELNALAKFIESGCKLLNYQGRIAIITYHSLEDKIVKQSFNHLSTSSIPIEVPIIDESIEYELVNKHPIVPSDEELKNNNRARSAKLRVIACVNKERR